MIDLKLDFEIVTVVASHQQRLRHHPVNGRPLVDLGLEHRVDKQRQFIGESLRQRATLKVHRLLVQFLPGL